MVTVGGRAFNLKGKAFCSLKSLLTKGIRILLDINSSLFEYKSVSNMKSYLNASINNKTNLPELKLYLKNVFRIN